MKPRDIAAMDDSHIIDPEFDYVEEDIGTLLLAEIEMREAGKQDWADILRRERFQAVR